MLSTRSLHQPVDASLGNHLAGVMLQVWPAALGALSLWGTRVAPRSSCRLARRQQLAGAVPHAVRCPVCDCAGWVLASAPPAPPQSYTSSPVDPQARLFYNPAYNTEPGMSQSKSLIRFAPLLVSSLLFPHQVHPGRRPGRAPGRVGICAGCVPPRRPALSALAACPPCACLHRPCCRSACSWPPAALRTCPDPACPSARGPALALPLARRRRAATQWQTRRCGACSLSTAAWTA